MCTLWGSASDCHWPMATGAAPPTVHSAASLPAQQQSFPLSALVLRHTRPIRLPAAPIWALAQQRDFRLWLVCVRMRRRRPLICSGVHLRVPQGLVHRPVSGGRCAAMRLVTASWGCLVEQAGPASHGRWGSRAQPCMPPAQWQQQASPPGREAVRLLGPAHAAATQLPRASVSNVSGPD